MFSGFNSENSIFHTLSPSSLTHLLLLPCPAFLYMVSLMPSENQGPFLPLMSIKATLARPFCLSNFSVLLYTQTCLLLMNQRSNPYPYCSSSMLDKKHVSRVGRELQEITHIYSWLIPKKERQSAFPFENVRWLPLVTLGLKMVRNLEILWE